MGLILKGPPSQGYQQFPHDSTVRLASQGGSNLVFMIETSISTHCINGTINTSMYIPPLYIIYIYMASFFPSNVGILEEQLLEYSGIGVPTCSK